MAQMHTSCIVLHSGMQKAVGVAMNFHKVLCLLVLKAIGALNCWMHEVTVVYYEVCWLIRPKERVRATGQKLYRNYFFDDLPSADFWQKL